MSNVSIRVTWMDEVSKVLSHLDGVNADKTGNNLYVYRTKLIGGPSVLDEIIPLANVRRVEYL